MQRKAAALCIVYLQYCCCNLYDASSNEGDRGCLQGLVTMGDWGYDRIEEGEHLNSLNLHWGLEVGEKWTISN